MIGFAAKRSQLGGCASKDPNVKALAGVPRSSDECDRESTHVRKKSRSLRPARSDSGESDSLGAEERVREGAPVRFVPVETARRRRLEVVSAVRVEPCSAPDESAVPKLVEDHGDGEFVVVPRWVRQQNRGGAAL